MEPHYWFLKTDDKLCKCGHTITEQEFEDTRQIEYAIHRGEIFQQEHPIDDLIEKYPKVYEHAKKMHLRYLENLVSSKLLKSIKDYDL